MMKISPLFTNYSIPKEARGKPMFLNKNSFKFEVFMPKVSNNSIKISNPMGFRKKPAKKQTLPFQKVKLLKVILIYTARKRLKISPAFLPKKRQKTIKTSVSVSDKWNSKFSSKNKQIYCNSKRKSQSSMTKIKLKKLREGMTNPQAHSDKKNLPFLSPTTITFKAVKV